MAIILTVVLLEEGWSSLILYIGLLLYIRKPFLPHLAHTREISLVQGGYVISRPGVARSLFCLFLACRFCRGFYGG
jgi:hypothetical protein